MVALIWPARAQAQAGPQLDLKWDAPENCPPGAAVVARIRRIAGPNGVKDTGLRAEGTVTQTGDGDYHLRLLIRAGTLLGVRTIDGKSCKDLAGAAAVALALLLSSEVPLDERELSGLPGAVSVHPDGGTASGRDDAAQETQPSATPTPPVHVPAPVSVPPVPHQQASGEARAARPGRWLVVLPRAALGIGPLRKLGFGLGIAGGVAFHDWRFLAEGTLWRTQHPTTTTLLDEYGADLQRFSVGVHGCRALWGHRLELAPCATLSVQHLSTRGDGPLIAPHTAGASWIAAGVGAQARLFMAAWLSLVLGVDGELETSRPVVQLGGVGTVERLAPAAATITIGSEWIF